LTQDHLSLRLKLYLSLLEYELGKQRALLTNPGWNKSTSDLKLNYKENKPVSVTTKTKRGLLTQTVQEFKEQMREHVKSLLLDLRELNLIQERDGLVEPECLNPAPNQWEGYHWKTGTTNEGIHVVALFFREENIATFRAPDPVLERWFKVVK